MNDIQVSLVASATRPVLDGGFQNWDRFYNSLKGNKLNWEVIFVGHVPPPHQMPENFKWIETKVKPAQCYEIGFRAAKGELIHWTADDADYDCKGRNCPDSLDRAYRLYKEVEAKFDNDKKTVIAFRPIEDGGDVWNFHHFFGGWEETPRMAPFALIDRKFFLKELGGYDRRFVSGQSENDVVMRFLEVGGRVEMAMDSFLYVHHRQVHPKVHADNKFREWYDTDRKFLEACWVVGGHGKYERGDKNAKVSDKRLLPLEPFEDKDILTVTQGDKGRW